MNDLQIFNSEEFGEIRTVTIDNEPMFCLADVCKALELTNSRVVSERLEEDERRKLNLPRQGETWFITESGLYTVILRSDKPSAKKFRKWVTSEVLPSIRKNGGYISGQEKLSDEELLEKAVLVAQKKIAERDAIIEKQKAKIEEDAPKALFADSVAASHTSILVGDMAKLICQNGVEIGSKRLFEWMRQNGYLMKEGSSRNMPTQKSMNFGWMEIKERVFQNPDGSIRITRTPLITGKGQIHFVNKFLRKELLQDADIK